MCTGAGGAMVDEARLSSVLSEFASTLATDFPIQAILDQLVERIVTVLPITSAGVTLIEPGADPRYVAASDASALAFEKLQTHLNEGPCLLAFRSGAPVAVPDLTLEQRFPRFAEAGAAAGLGAVFTFPLFHGDDRFGALDLYRATSGDLDEHAMETAQTLANVAAAYVLNARARDDAIRQADHLRHLSLHDDLTGLPNRLLLKERIAHASRRAQRTGAHAAILFIDLDRFKRVNDTHGHHIGDQLLRAVAHRLARLVRPGDTLARVYGDEFVLLSEDLAGRGDVEILTDRVHAAFTAPFPTSSGPVPITASIGVAFAGPGEYVNETLVDEADSAMYDAKQRGANDEVIDMREGDQHAKRGRLSCDLRACLEAPDGGDLAVVFQPLVSCADSGVVGVEALVRWNHPDRGPVPAAAIIDVAEQSGLIQRLGLWVLDRACRSAVQWEHDHPGTSLDLAVNVSALQVTSPTFVEDVAGVLASTGLAPHRLVLEVTENVLITDSECAMLALGRIKGLGVRVALDDFGTGYSSLSYLHRLPIDIVKIDRSFVANIDRTAKGDAIVASVIHLAHALDLLVVTEGVETATQQAAVTRVGADQAQGFFYSRPVDAASIDLLLSGPARPTLP